MPQAEDTFGEASHSSLRSTQVWRAGARVGLFFRRERCYQTFSWLGTQNKELPELGEG